MKSRRSIRKFKSIKVPMDVVNSILDLARWSPSAHNAQPWRCIVIDDENVKARLASEMGRAWLSDMLKDGVQKDKAEEIVRVESWERITKSPVIVIVCLTMEDMHKYPDRRRRKAEYLMGVQSVAAYIQTCYFQLIIMGLEHAGSAHHYSVQMLLKKFWAYPEMLNPKQ